MLKAFISSFRERKASTLSKENYQFSFFSASNTPRICALLLSEKGFLPSKNHFIDYMNINSPCGAVCRDDDGDDGIDIDLNRVERAVKRIVIITDTTLYSFQKEHPHYILRNKNSSIELPDFKDGDLSHSKSAILAIFERSFIGWHLKLPSIACHDPVLVIRKKLNSHQNNTLFNQLNDNIHQCMVANVPALKIPAKFVKYLPWLSQVDYDQSMNEFYNSQLAVLHGHQFLLNCKRLWGNAIHSEHRQNALTKWIKDGADWGYSLYNEMNAAINDEDRLDRLMLDAKLYPIWTAFVLKQLDKQIIMNYCKNPDRADAVYKILPDNELIAHQSLIGKRNTLSEQLGL